MTLKRLLLTALLLLCAQPASAELESIKGTTGFDAPLSTEIGWTIDDVPYRPAMIVDLADVRPLEVGDTVDAFFECQYLNPNDTRHTSGLGSAATRQDTLFEYNKAPSLNVFMVLADQPVLDALPYVTNPYSDPNSKMFTTNTGTNVPFLIHHEPAVKRGSAVITDTNDRYLIPVVYAEKNGANPSGSARLLAEYTSGQCKLDYEIKRGAIVAAPSGNGAHLLPAGAVVFDGTNDYMTRGSDLTGSVDGKKGIFFGRVKLNGGSGVGQVILRNSGGFFSVTKTSANKIQIAGFNAAGTNILLLSSTGAYSTGSENRILAAWDLGAGTGYLRINGVDVLDNTTKVLVNDNLDYTRANWSFGATDTGTSKLNASVRQIYFNMAESLDVSNSTNEEKFYDGAATVNFGTNGTYPTGNQPAIYFNSSHTAFGLNEGYGYNFTITGALTAE